MIVTHKISMDLEGKGKPQGIRVNQWDAYTREVRVALYEGKAPWQIPEIGNVVIYARKPDGTICAYDTLPNGECAWKREDNMLTFALAPQILAAPGVVEVQVSMIRDEAVLNTFCMEVQVDPVEKGSGKNTTSENYHVMTGILPAPERASVGRYVRVAEVNDDGKVLRVEAVELPECKALDEGEVTEILEDYLAENPPVNGKNGYSIYYMAHDTAIQEKGDTDPETGLPGPVTAYSTTKINLSENGLGVKVGDLLISKNGILCKVTRLDINVVYYSTLVDLTAGIMPVKGVDYFTDADKAELVNAVLAALNNPVA